MHYPDRAVAAMKFLTGRQTPNGAVPFKDQNLAALFGQVRSGSQTVVSGTDDDYVVSVVS